MLPICRRHAVHTSERHAGLASKIRQTESNPDFVA